MSAERCVASDAFGSSQVVVKRSNLGDGRPGAVASGSAANGALITSVPRTSGLQAPVMELTGHSGEVFVARFNPEGNYIASGSMDRSISKYPVPAGGPDSLTEI
jgi:Prp8 binding protein